MKKKFFLIVIFIAVLSACFGQIRVPSGPVPTPKPDTTITIKPRPILGPIRPKIDTIPFPFRRELYKVNQDSSTFILKQKE